MKSSIARILTIEDFNPNGRFAKESQASLLRLKGCWFKEAGFRAGDQVLVQNISPGVIELRVYPPALVDPAFTHAIEQLNAVLNEHPKSLRTTGSFVPKNMVNIVVA